MVGALLLWLMLLPSPPDAAGHTHPQAWATDLARNLPDSLKREVVDAASRWGLYAWSVEVPAYDCFDGVITVFFYRHTNNPLPYPHDPLGPGSPLLKRLID